MSSYSTSYGDVVIGDVGDLGGSGGSALYGYAPLTTDKPTAIYPVDYKSQIESKENVTTQLGMLTDTVFASVDELRSALNNPQMFGGLKNNTVWVWGSYEYGGLGFINNGSNTSCTCVMILGISQVSGGYKVVVSNPTLSYYYSIDNTGNTGISNLGTTVASNGQHENGIMFFDMYDFDDQTTTFQRTNQYGVIFNYVQNTMGYQMESPSIAYQNVWFYDSVESADDRYLDGYTNLMPSTNPILRYEYDIARTLQRKINTFNAFIVNDSLNLVDGTSLFSGSVSNEVSNPYPNSTSKGGGGYGGGQRYSESCGDDGTPDVDLIGTGLVDLYNLDKTQMQDFCNYLYSGITDNIANSIKRMLANPLDGVITAHLVRFTPSTSTIGNIIYCGFDTGVSAKYVDKQYYSCIYEIEVPNFYNGFLDYNGNTQLKIYIPYIGIRELNMNDFAGGVLKLTVKIDIVTGAVNAYVWSKMKQKGFNHVELNTCLYEFTGNCSMSIPLSGTDWKNTFTTLSGIAMSVITQNPIGVAGAVVSAASGLVTTDHVSNTSANYGYMGDQRPYIILNHPEVSLPAYFRPQRGYKTNVTVSKLRDAIDNTDNRTFFIKVREGTLDLTNIHATDEEKEEIARLLYQGVYYEHR